MLLFEVLWPENAGRVMEEVWPDQELRSKFTISPQKLEIKSIHNGKHQKVLYTSPHPEIYIHPFHPYTYSLRYYICLKRDYFSKANTSQRILCPVLSSVLQLLQKMR